MRRSRLVVATALCSAVLIGAQAGAAGPVTLTLPDAANDGNALNGQVVSGDPLDGAATPAGSQPDKDITAITLQPTTIKKRGKTTCTGFTATITLSGPASTDGMTIYRITGVTKVNARTFWLVYDGLTTELAYGVDPSATGTTSYTPLKRLAVVKGNTVTFTILESDLKGVGETNQGLSWTRLGAHTRSNLVAVTVPMWDKVVVDPAKAFTLC